MTATSALDELILELEKAIERDDFQRALERVRLDREDLETFLHFRDDQYTRNLVHRTGRFELLALCWRPGQITPVHDHAGSDGWVLGVDGEVEEVRYQVAPGVDGRARVDRSSSGRAGAGALLHINDDMAWHTVANPGPVDAVTLHCYSPPVSTCQIVDASTGSIAEKRLVDFVPVSG